MKTDSAQRPHQIPAVLASAIASIRWPLDAASHPPLHLKPLDQLQEIRKREQQQDGIAIATRLDPSHPLATSSLPLTLQELFPESDLKDDDEHNGRSRHFGVVSTALILLGHGLVDEAHSLVTPYSWPEDMHFNHGPVLYHTVNTAVQTYATYAHSLVHRHEGFHTGEFGMQGWQNANYWSNAVMKSQGLDDLPHADLFRHISKIVVANTVVGSTTNGNSGDMDRIRQWADQHNMRADSNYYFDSRAVHELCACAMQDDDDASTISRFRSFAERVAETELRVVLGHALQRAGFDCSIEDVVSMHNDFGE
jgi:hypothetical protein